jgi:ubiquinone/menaquinone biosynthesis C-methylase UbiE
MNGRSGKPQVGREHYGAGYENRRRFVSYFNQTELVRQAAPERVLEVGIGSGFLARHLRAGGLRVSTVDFDPTLAPDTVGSVTALPFPASAFDVVCCFETLEHLPFSDFVPALRELARVSSRRVLLSLPDVTPYFRLVLALGRRTRTLDRAFDTLALFPRAHRFDGQHHWEIGKRGTSLRTVRQAIASVGLRLERSFRDYDDPHHRLFSCSKG